MAVRKKFVVKPNFKLLEKAIKLSGSQAELARKLEKQANVKCYPQKVNEWRTRGIVPPYWVKPLAVIMEVEPKDIDPTLYG